MFYGSAMKDSCFWFMISILGVMVQWVSYANYIPNLHAITRIQFYLLFQEPPPMANLQVTERYSFH